MPHPEVYMDYVRDESFTDISILTLDTQIAENLGPRAWKYQVGRRIKQFYLLG